ncbi:CYTH and CHAD domain-containing protein [Arthrobacter sp. CJ23]|uniref:CYTH and CHAD domain-containing protein n=1 Tax=Arthrobacter sp. CJ23 TaxID=2972479 RepID=UPI00215CF955|nr:CYTH and CHAD domain-containing protein [Arthrobacter sp. CJ23]UVJ41412.1 CYTH and CHAD domain-containing protein [Arthrobacter sp. CJ23]
MTNTMKPGQGVQAEQTVETERKYDVDSASPLPALLEIPGVWHVAEPAETLLEAVYFDTSVLALAARGITLRRRTGGTDHGWHLKIPLGRDSRREIHAPLGQPETVPEGLAEYLPAYTRGDAVHPIVRLATRRTTYRLYGLGGEHLADFVDDHVHAVALEDALEQSRPGSGRPGTDWREWEIELVHGTGDLFAAAAETLSAAGASRSPHASKLARALGDGLPPRRATDMGQPRKKGQALDVATAYLGGQITELLTHDAGVRLGTPDAVHRMRSATRRIRSALSTYRPLFTKAKSSRLDEELRLLARILGRPRDAEVLRERLRRDFRQLPPDSIPGIVAESIEQELGTDYNEGYREVLAALGSRRYYRLLDDLEDFRDHPPAMPLAAKPARKATAMLLGKAAKRLRRAQKSVARAGKGPDRDAALHRVRKDAKLLRHAAESVSGIHGKPATSLAKAAQRQQMALGEQHDSVVARTLLRRLGSDPALPASASSAYGRLARLEKHLGATAEARYRKARRKARRIRLRD